MKNLHLLIIGSSEEEVQKRTADAFNTAFAYLAKVGDDANSFRPNEFGFEFTDLKSFEELVHKGFLDYARKHDPNMRVGDLILQFESYLSKLGYPIPK